MKTTQEQWNRRKFIAASLGFSGVASTAQSGIFDLFKDKPNVEFDRLSATTTQDQHIGYSNYYELGTSKSDPAENIDLLNTDNWMVDVDGANLTIEQLMGRSYEDLSHEWFRFRCVEAWSMNVQADGIPLSEIIEEFGDKTKKYVQFECVQQKGLPGQGRFSSINWPYREYLRMEEAMNPLCWAVFGYYGEPSAVNGSPLRISIPWQYGFTQPKGVVKILCTDEKPISSWEQLAPYEYGPNARIVDPNQPHPRWSQATERFIHSEGTDRVSTLYLNGYEEEVGGLYI